MILHSLLALTYNELFFHCVSLIIQHIEIYIFIYLQVSWGSIVGTAMKINKEQFDIWILARVRDFSILQNIQTSIWPTQPPIQWVQEFFPGGEGDWGVMSHSHLASGLNMGGTVLLFPLYAFKVWKGKTSPLCIVRWFTFHFACQNSVL